MASAAISPESARSRWFHFMDAMSDLPFSAGIGGCREASLVPSVGCPIEPS